MKTHKAKKASAGSPKMPKAKTVGGKMYASQPSGKGASKKHKKMY